MYEDLEKTLNVSLLKNLSKNSNTKAFKCHTKRFTKSIDRNVAGLGANQIPSSIKVGIIILLSQGHCAAKTIH